MKKIAIITSFTSADCAYSLNNVVQDQIKMLVQNGYSPSVVVMEGFQATGAYALSQVELLYAPPIRRSNHVEKDDTFDEDVEKTYKFLNVALKDVDVIFTHDLIYQPAELKTNVACRRIAGENPNKRWLHWIHSATAPSMLLKELGLEGTEYGKYSTSKFPNSFVIFPNAYSIPRVAKNFGYELDEVKCVHHPIDLAGYHGMHDITKEMIEKYSLLSADVICVYPARLDRGKNLEVPVEILGQMKKMGQKIKMIVVDFHSTGGDKVTYRQNLKELAIRKGYAEGELIFTSDFKKETACRVPQQVVRDLFMLSNIFIMPSHSESYSLITQEASTCGNIIMVNRDFPPFLDIFGDAPYKGQFSSNIDALTGMDGDTNTEYGDRDAYMRDMAGKLLYEVKNNRVIRMKDRTRKERNLEYVFRNELEPLLHFSTQEVCLPKREMKKEVMNQEAPLL